MIEPLISIVLPTHNGSHYVEDSIRSCISQSYKNWELIIVDDASTDDTPMKIATFTDTRVRIVRHQTNRRLPGALNTGFSLAGGEYLTWTSDDNYYRPAALQEMVAFLREHPNVGVVYTDYSIVDERGAVIYNISVSDPEELIHGNCVGSSFLYRREVQVKLGGYSEDMFLAEDYDFWVRASISFCLAPLHKDLYCHRFHPGSLTSRYTRERVLAVVEKSLARNLGKMSWVSPSMKSEVFRRLAREAARRGEKGSVVKYMLHSAFSSPPEFLVFAKAYLGRRGFLLSRSRR